MKVNTIEIPEGEIQKFCQRWKVSELALFGSALQFDYPIDSDLDILISFNADANWGLFDLVRMENELEGIFQRDVDLVEKNAVENSENYIRSARILHGAKVIFTA